MKTEEAKEIDKVQNRVVIYPIPVGAAKQRDYIVKVRPLGEEQWQEVGCYQVNTESRTAVIKPLRDFTVIEWKKEKFCLSNSLVYGKISSIRLVLKK